MIYVLLILVFLSVVGFLFLRDQRFLKKNLRDVAPKELKKFLNLPTDEATFSTRLSGKKPEPRASRRLLNEMNDPDQ